jgi:protein phosphatase
MSIADPRSELHSFLQLYLDIIMTFNPTDILRQTPRFQVPALSPSLIRPLFGMTIDLFKTEPLILTIDQPIIVIGDLHGSLFDLIRILKTFGIPPFQSYLLLGDFIDRGEFSTETIILLLLLKLFYPESIFLIRGNHEFFGQSISHDELFLELSCLYSDSLLAGELILVFEWMPIAATVMDYAMAVHGGIPSTLSKLSQLAEIPRPISHFEPKSIEDLMWSDPSETCPDVTPSMRGLGVTYGINSVSRFLSQSGLEIVIRGHQAITCGVEEALNQKVLTVFSASNYCGESKRKSGIVKILDGGSWEKHVFSPLPMIRRSDIQFVSSEICAQRKKGNVGVMKNARRTVKGSSSLGVLGMRGLLRNGDPGNVMLSGRPKAGSLQRVILHPIVIPKSFMESL